MYDSLKTGLIEWNVSRNEREKLQHSYVAAIVAVLFMAGIVSLFNYRRSEQLFYLAVALLTALVVNLVAWSLLKTLLLDKLPRPTAPRRTTKR